MVEAYVAAINACDAEAATTLFAADGMIEAPRRSSVGRDAIRGDLRNFIDQGGTLTTIDVTVDGNTVIATQEVRQPRIQNFGIERIIRIGTFVISAGEIASVSPEPDTSDPDTTRFTAAQEAGGGGGGGIAGSGPASLPATGSGGLADAADAVGTSMPLLLASVLAGLTLLVGLGASVALKRQRAFAWRLPGAAVPTLRASSEADYLPAAATRRPFRPLSLGSLGLRHTRGRLGKHRFSPPAHEHRGRQGRRSDHLIEAIPQLRAVGVPASTR